MKKQILTDPGRENQQHSLKPEKHPFVNAPHKTLISLSLPLLLSLIAEPLTGLVDTIFVANLGSTPLAALGVGTAVLSSIFWIFNFLGIGSQTEVAQAMGNGDISRLKQITTLAMVMAFFIGVALILLSFPLVSSMVRWMEATGGVHETAVEYIRIRMFGGPAILISIAAFGVMRGQQNMTTPLWVAGGINILNMVLDPLFIFGFGAFPPIGVAGAALASVISQWMGAIACLWYLFKKLGHPGRVKFSEALGLLVVGRDLFIRTGMLILFLLLSTRAATAVSSESGAAHQVIRQTWFFTAFLMDAYAMVGQSLVAYFLGGDQLNEARRVGTVVCCWSLGTGFLLAAVMLMGQDSVILLMVPGSAVNVFKGAWQTAALTQPLNALAFATDGIHWGTGDYAYLRNVVITATICCCSLLFFFENQGSLTLAGVWGITIVWVMIRACGGLMRIWPGVGLAPLKQ